MTEARERTRLQNRCPVPVAVRGVGSIPMRFRHPAQELTTDVPDLLQEGG